MILNSHEYNPLPKIFSELPVDANDFSHEILDMIQAELFKGGIVPENAFEFKQVLDILLEEFYGKK